VGSSSSTMIVRCLSAIPGANRDRVHWVPFSQVENNFRAAFHRPLSPRSARIVSAGACGPPHGAAKVDRA